MRTLIDTANELFPRVGYVRDQIARSPVTDAQCWVINHMEAVGMETRMRSGQVKIYRVESKDSKLLMHFTVRTLGEICRWNPAPLILPRDQRLRIEVDFDTSLYVYGALSAHDNSDTCVHVNIVDNQMTITHTTLKPYAQIYKIPLDVIRK